MADAVELDILIVEDNDLQRKSLYDLLSGWGHHVRGCDTLTECRELLGNQYDLILLDMKLPDGDGLEFLAKEVPEPVQNTLVIMTAFADVRTAVEAIKLGAYDYLPKPFENEQLRKIVRNISDRVNLGRRVTSLSCLAVRDYENVWQLDNMIGTHALRTIFEKAERVASTSDTTVLVLGETGTGKGMLAKALHRLSRRAGKPFVEVNCSAIPGQLIESEIFGYEKGAFTDAKVRKPGLLEVADTGTVFLDEIGDMEVNLQSKLLKVIEDKEFRPLGSARTVRVDVRIIAATSRDLRALVRDGKFREDLYYRLSVVPITMPPLREHRDSIMPLAEFFLGSFCKEMGKKVKGFTPAAMDSLMKYAWPGNVRELRNCIERSLILTNAETIDSDILGLGEGHVSLAATAGEASGDIPPMSLADCEKRLISSVLKSAEGNRNKAADILKIHRTTLYKKIEEYGLE